MFLLLLATIKVVSDDASVPLISSSAGRGHVWLTEPRNCCTSPWWQHYLCYNCNIINYPDKQSIVYCNIFGNKSDVGATMAVPFRPKVTQWGLNWHITHKYYTVYVATRDNLQTTSNYLGRLDDSICFQ